MSASFSPSQKFGLAIVSLALASSSLALIGTKNGANTDAGVPLVELPAGNQTLVCAATGKDNLGQTTEILPPPASENSGQASAAADQTVYATDSSSIFSLAWPVAAKTSTKNKSGAVTSLIPDPLRPRWLGQLDPSVSERLANALLTAKNQQNFVQLAANKTTASAAQSLKLGQAYASWAIGAQFAQKTQPDKSYLAFMPAKAQKEAPLLFGAARLQVVGSGNLRGMTYSQCQLPVLDTWLIGGSAEAGNSTSLLLTNPNSVAAKVKVEIFDAAGLAQQNDKSKTGQVELTVPGGSSKEILLESYTSAASLALHVTAQNAKITAQLNMQSAPGLLAHGVATVTSSTAHKQLVFPGVHSSENNELANLNGVKEQLLRLFNPSDKTTQVKVEILTALGRSELPGAAQISLLPGAVLDLPLTGLEPGFSSIIASADIPIFGAVKLVNAGKINALYAAGDKPEAANNSPTNGSGQPANKPADLNAAAGNANLPAAASAAGTAGGSVPGAADSNNSALSLHDTIGKTDSLQDFAWLPAVSLKAQNLLLVPENAQNAGLTVTNALSTSQEVTAQFYNAKGAKLATKELTVDDHSSVFLPLPAGTTAVEVSGNQVASSLFFWSHLAGGDAIAVGTALLSESETLTVPVRLLGSS